MTTITAQSIVESGNACILNNRRNDTVIFESGNKYQMYGKKNEQKLKLIGQLDEAPDFDRWDEYQFQRQYQYIGHAEVVKRKRTCYLNTH